MEEYVTEAIVLRKNPFKEHDARYSLFTKRFGRMVAKAVSSRKITSKLAGHLEPGMRARVRLVERNGLVLVDALKEGSVGERISLNDLHILDRILPENVSEPLIWSLIEDGIFDWRKALRLLGWDPDEASCFFCGSGSVAGFSLGSQEFLCAPCLSRFRRHDILLV